ncbi:MAG: hypothetical protein Q8L47_01220 [bacterium]|nr:hypothetical protein [bacterium]
MDNQETQKETAKTDSSKKNTYIVVAIVVIVGLAWMFGRGGSYGMPGRSIIGLPGGVNVDTNLDGSGTYTTKDGSVTVGKNTYPDNWPSDAPKYGNAQIQFSGSTNPESGDEGAVVTFTTTDSVQQVTDFYKNELSKNGWKVEESMTAGQMTLMSGKKGTMTLTVQIVSAEKAPVTVTVAIGK